MNTHREMKSFLRRYNNWNWNWNLDSALRYEKAISLINKIKPITIVEVGCGSRGISAYSRYPSFGVDIAFNEAIDSGLQRRIKASGTALPFRNRSVDFVISADMLEHVNTTMRAAVIKEMFRVVKDNGVVYLAVPVGQESEYADRKVNNAYMRKYGISHPMLCDHIKNGLPQVREIINVVQEETRHKDWKVKVADNTPIKLWELTLMLFGVESLIPGLRHFQRPLLKSIYPILRKIKSKQNYRIVVYASKNMES
ncbi:MAG: class I SAM-dependent methyltransferase [Candidatus Brocadia sp.]|nr:class I SAM-dependent methyltransferase [Candidatus Brocadia sp.]